MACWAATASRIYGTFIAIRRRPAAALLSLDIYISYSTWQNWVSLNAQEHFHDKWCKYSCAPAMKNEDTEPFNQKKCALLGLSPASGSHTVLEVHSVFGYSHWRAVCICKCPVWAYQLHLIDMMSINGGEVNKRITWKTWYNPKQNKCNIQGVCHHTHRSYWSSFFVNIILKLISTVSYIN